MESLLCLYKWMEWSLVEYLRVSECIFGSRRRRRAAGWCLLVNFSLVSSRVRWLLLAPLVTTTCLLDYMRAGVYLWVIRHNGNRQRSYQRKHTSSRPITEVKCVRAQIVLGWGTAWEHWVTLASLNFLLPLLPCPGGRRQQDGWGTDTYARIFVLRLVVLLPRRG